MVESAEGSKIEVKAAAGIVAPEPSPETKSTEQVVSSIETQQQAATPKQTIESTAVAKSVGTTVPSKPQKSSLPKGHDEKQGSEDDEDEDLQAALQASMKAPSSPQVASGAQGSNPKGSSNLQQQESELMSQLDTLMTEPVVLDSLPKPTIVQKARGRSIHKVIADLKVKLEEIESQKKMERSSNARKVQEESTPTTKSVGFSPPVQPQPAQVTAVAKKPMILMSPASARPSSLEESMAKSMPKSGTEATQVEVIPKPKEEPQQKAEPVQQPTSAKEKAVGQSKPLIMMGKALEQLSPPPRVESKSPAVKGPQEESQESLKEEAREPSKEKSREIPKEESREPPKEESRRTKRHESREPRERKSGTIKEERSRSSKRRDQSPEPVKQSETGQAEETSTAGESTTRGRPRLALMDKPRKARPACHGWSP